MESQDDVQLLDVAADRKDDLAAEQNPPPYVHPTTTQRAPSPMQQPRQGVTQPHQGVTPMQYPQMGASQQSTNTVVVAGQPTTHLPPVAVVQQPKRPSQNILILSLVTISVCSLVCGFPFLCLLIPGVIFAVVGFNYSHSHDPARRQVGRGFDGVSLCCSVTSIIAYVVTVLCIILYYSILIGSLNSYHPTPGPSRPPYYPYCSYSCYQACEGYHYHYYYDYPTCDPSCYCYTTY